MPPALLGPAWDEPVSALRLFAIALAALAAAVALLEFRAWTLRRSLARIPIRIHVAGTRGKSTTTRLIAAALRAHGLRVYGKTTGAEPRLLQPDGSESPFPRSGPPSVREQARLMNLAAKAGVDAVVVECMAIEPEMMWASEALFVRATILVVTNARPDHFEEIGERQDAMVEALGWLIPPGGQVVVAAEAATDAFRRKAAERGATLTLVDTAGLEPADANRKLALAAGALHGVDAALAAPAMDGITPDPGHFTERALIVSGQPIRFANAFSCNDVDSFALHWRRDAGIGRPVVVLNARADRPMRSKHFLEFLARQDPTPFLFVAGDSLAVVQARRAGFPDGSVRLLRTRGSRALAEVAALAQPGSTIWGVGNYQGFGAQLTAALAESDVRC